ncbi:MAG: GEVED domain-containing protein [Bacteroidales bacterium]|nr:GEVED domain-containing protein [Bacteroidales bacterium]
MKNLKTVLVIFTLGLVAFSVNWAVSDSTPTERERRSGVIGWVDNNAYWQRLAEQGLAVLNPDVKVPAAVYTGSKINSASVVTDDSPDVPVTDVGSSTQSENSVFVDPGNADIMLNSNNSTSVTGPPSYGADNLYTFDFGETFDGSISGAAGNNQGDPAACIGTDGRWYIGYIANSGQAVAYSDNQGESWTRKQVAPNPGQLADKNHLWIDALQGSPYENYLYDAWSDFGGAYDNEIVVSFSSDNGETWSSKQRISLGVNAGNHNQGVNLSTGPNGEVYAAWGIYDGWPQDEKAIGFAKSLDGGATWETAFRIINNIRGIRQSGVPQNMRVNSFPSMAVDVSGGSNDGNIYVVWTNVGVPGQNSGSDRDVYFIRSSDGGDNWSEPVRVNQDAINQGKAHYLPWITCDPSNGTISVIWYDNRNTSANQAEAWVATSSDAGDTWDDFKVSDVAFTPSPIPGMASGYFGDYLGITALDGKVYPCWTDNRSGHAMTYVSVFQTITITNPFALQASVDQETGACDLSWNYNEGSGFLNFRIYRGDEMIAETEELTYTDQIPDYGYYTYKVTAYYGGTTESEPTITETQWGSSTMEVVPGEYVANLYFGDSVVQLMKIKNTGVLSLEFSLSPFFTPANAMNYKAANGGGDEFISKVKLAGLDHSSGYESYSDYTTTFARLRTGQPYEIEVFNGNAFEGDQCAVWIDWNGNGDFEEDAILLRPDETNQVYKGTINPAKGLDQGTVLMRIRLAGPGKLSPFGDSQYGEVEDYSLLIASWLTLDPDEGEVDAGDSVTLNLKFNSTDLETGTYTDLIKFVSNELDNPFYSVPVTLNVTDLTVDATADPSGVCLGSEVQLMANPQGGTGSYTFAWSSIPDGFTSDQQNPVVTPVEDTRYIVLVNDGVLSMTDSLDVAVYGFPVADLGADQVLCGETEYLLDAANPGSTYLWSTGETTQSILATGEGENEFWVVVTNENNCSDSDTVRITFATFPLVDLGDDTTFCQDQSYILDAGNPGSTYLWSSGETSQTIVVDTSKYGYGTETFSVVVTNQFGCEGTDEASVEILNCTGIDEFIRTVSVKLFPNPSGGIFTLELKSPENLQVTIKVMSVSGTLVYEKEGVEINGTYSGRIDLSGLSPGVYAVFVVGEGFVTNKKIVLRK